VRVTYPGFRLGVDFGTSNTVAVLAGATRLLITVNA
jgi:hypothetical protein